MSETNVAKAEAEVKSTIEAPESVPEPSKETVAEESKTVNAEPESSSIEPLVKAVKLNKDQQAKLQKLIDSIPKILAKIKNKDYDEIFGYRINVSGEKYVEDAIRNEILLKFLIANNYDVDVTINKLVETLNWRSTFQPLSAAYNEKFVKELDDLGVITYLPDEKLPNYKVGTWNLYGNLKNPKTLFEKFGGSDSKLPGTVFLRWRIGLMEKALLFVDFKDPDNSKIVQIHDYNNVSFFNIDKGMRASTKEVIQIFGDNYPELLSTKFFINVPSLMSWVFGFFLTIGLISKETLAKFRPLNHGNMSEWFDKESLPSAYNGGAKTLVKLIFSLDQALKAKVPEYAAVILEKTNKQALDEVTNDVE